VYACKGQYFSFEKKKQQTFATLVRSIQPLQAKKTKVFWFFFSKKNTFFLRPQRPRVPHPAPPRVATVGITLIARKAGANATSRVVIVRPRSAP
jgi:hypothetical protein